MKRNILFPGMVAFVALLVSGYVECHRLLAEEIEPRSVWKAGAEVMDRSW